MKMELIDRTMRGVLICLLAAGLPALAQNSSQQRPSTRPAPSQPAGKPQHGGQKPAGRPGGGHGGQPPKPNPAPTPLPQPPSRPVPKPLPQPPPKPGPRPPAHRPPQWGRPPAVRPPYHFRPNDWAYLHRYYSRNLIYINRSTRPVFVVGGFFPYTYIQYITPLPPNVYSYLPPPPPGYRMGYCQGYVVVYDPVTYYIVNVINLLQ
ncbi:MAG TPA: hypothetical protein VME86_01970 [Acidobacteriaceae bacterium]|nr:hypothetical protein [Acidobacteriaceae bacterium]